MSDVSCFIRAARITTEIRTLYRVDGEDKSRRAITINISTSGVLLRAMAPLDLGTRIEMTFLIPEAIGTFQAGQLTCIGEVVRFPLPTRWIPFPVAVQFVGSWMTAG